MSEFHVQVVRLGKIEKHPSADRLQITHVHGETGEGYPCISQLGAFKEGDLAVYLPVDSLVPASNPAFSFLVPPPVRKDDMTDIEWEERQRRYEKEKTEKVRIKAKKLRGIFSMGLLVPVEEALAGTPQATSAAEGDDVQELLGVEKWEPDEANRRPGHPSGPQGPSGQTEPDPGFLPEYTDIEGLRKWSKILEIGEEVVITEKIHGQNARYLFKENRLWVGSHHQLKRAPHVVTEDEMTQFEREKRIWSVKHVFHSIYRGVKTVLPFLPKVNENRAPRHPVDVAVTNWWHIAYKMELEKLLSMIPDIAVYGELYGSVQDLKYGCPNEIRFRAFDAMDVNTRRYLDYDDFKQKMDLLGIETVPLLYRGPWTDGCRDLAEGKTTLGGGHVREGIVIRPVKERRHDRCGRVILKLVGQSYLLR